MDKSSLDAWMLIDLWFRIQACIRGCMTRDAQGLGGFDPGSEWNEDISPTGRLALIKPGMHLTHVWPAIAIMRRFGRGLVIFDHFEMVKRSP